MKAIVQEQYGSVEVLKVLEVEMPTPKNNEVLIQVKATALNAPDWRLLKGKPLVMRMMTGLIRPKNKIKGCEFSGRIVELGQGITDFKVGDTVMGDVADAGFGAFSDYICVKSSLLARKPESLTHIEAAALPVTAVTALQGVRNIGQLKAGEDVLVVGASGGVGSYALQIAKYFGGNVTAVISEKNEKQAKDLGADEVLVYTKIPLDHIEYKYDLIIAVNGYNKIETYSKLLKPQGRLVMIGGKSMKQIIFVTAFGGLISRKNGKKFKGLLARANGKDLSYIGNLVDKKEIRPVIEKEIPFEDIPKGLSELEKGHVSGKIVVWVNRD
ncbi:Alcohol dehydrogenase [Petrocella atlantisensis]|uniref:Alcohol dehydrogenase n=1 Tax=Petrocella atlantisensis TaxID=2173034 RepID=A0A3P7NVC2_9FIRM|nr:NAD(P)-dependent alcohol dehydrogenase [Petrocella atlantisensis]PKM54022.1 MAG: alcohol dehydrogenase [Firmicutes bacterium HGW-Firmicutes-5]VDN47094.1 Alcohol dehydrogenase [Petrocella atlantisensis]